MEKTKEEKKGLFFRFINGVEVIGNKLPHPFYLFTILIVVAIVLSVIFAGVSVTYESVSSKGTGGEIVTVTIKNLLNKETINYVTQNLYSIYNRNLLGGLYRENPVKSRNYEAVKSSKKWENVGNSYIIPALLLYRYSYI